MLDINIRSITSIAELDTIESIWRHLEERDKNATVFQSWLWNRTWCETVLGTRDRAQLNVLVAEGFDGQPRALLPFFTEPLVGLPFKIMQFLGHKMSYHNDILLADCENVVFVEHLVDILSRSIGSGTLVHLRHLNHHSLFTKALAAKSLADTQCPRVWAEPDPSINDQSQRLGRSMKKTLKWSTNKLCRKFGDIEFTVISGDKFTVAFDEMIRLHHLRFSSLQRNTVLTGSNLKFLRLVTSKLAESGSAEVLQLRINNAVIAAALMIRDKQRYFFVQSGLDPEFSIYSPMRLLLVRALSHAFDTLGYKIFDFGPGYEDYKYSWKSKVSTNDMCCLNSGGLIMPAIGYLYSEMFKRSLPKLSRKAEKAIKKL